MEGKTSRALPSSLRSALFHDAPQSARQRLAAFPLRYSLLRGSLFLQAHHDCLEMAATFLEILIKIKAGAGRGEADHISGGRQGAGLLDSLLQGGSVL